MGAGLSLSDLDRMMDQMYGGQPSYTGKLVSQSTALAVSAVWSCIDALAGDIATLPLMTYRRIAKGRERATEHYLWGLLQDGANPELSAWRFKHLMQTWVLLWGNAYAEIEINGRGQVTALWPWRPDRVTVSRVSKGGPLQYTYKMTDGKLFTLPHERIFHLRGLSTDGVMGLSPIDVHRQRVGLALAIEEHGARFFGQGARPLGILQHPNKLDDAAYLRLKKDFTDQHQGLENAHRVAVLEEGITWKETGANMVDAQYIESAKLTEEGIARIYKVPPYRIGLETNATNASLEEQSLGYVLYSIGPWTVDWESEIHWSLLSTRELKDIFTRFNFMRLLRGNHEALAKFIATVRQWGIMTADEIRSDYLDLNDLPDGKGADVWQPVNMMPEGGDPKTAPQNMQVVPPKPKPNGKPNGAFHHQ